MSNLEAAAINFFLFFASLVLGAIITYFAVGKFYDKDRPFPIFLVSISFFIFARITFVISSKYFSDAPDSSVAGIMGHVVFWIFMIAGALSIRMCGSAYSNRRKRLKEGE